MNQFTFSLAVAAGLFAGAANAAVTVYTDRTAWEAAAGTIIATEDFGGGAFVNGLAISKGSNAGGAWLDVVNPATDYSFDPVTAVGFDLDMTPAGFGSGHVWTVHFAGGGSETLAEIASFNGFYGIVAMAPVNKLTVAEGTGPGVETYLLDNMSFGVVPEPGTWAMLIAGFGLVGTAVRRRREALAA